MAGVPNNGSCNVHRDLGVSCQGMQKGPKAPLRTCSSLIFPALCTLKSLNFPALCALKSMQVAEAQQQAEQIVQAAREDCRRAEAELKALRDRLQVRHCFVHAGVVV